MQPSRSQIADAAEKLAAVLRVSWILLGTEPDQNPAILPMMAAGRPDVSHVFADSAIDLCACIEAGRTLAELLAQVSGHTDGWGKAANLALDALVQGTQLVEEAYRRSEAGDPRIPPQQVEAIEGAVRVLRKEACECLVTLQQAAAMVSRSKRSLERRKAKMPLPRVEGGGGKPTEWAWSKLRPWLEREFDRQLPERFPADQFRRFDG